MAKKAVTDDLAATLTRRGVRFLIPSYVDMHGVSKSKMVPIDHFADMMAGSELCTGAALDGVPQEIHDEEISAHPDPSSCAVLPWRRDTAWFASDLWCEGRPFEPCSRNILKRVLARADAIGFKVNVGIEAEFFVLRDSADGGYVPVSTRKHLEKPAYDVRRLIDNLDWIGELVAAMNELGWDVFSFDHEDGIGQFEIDFTYADALRMADRYVLFRLLAGEIARKHGHFATFMPKPYPDRAGSGAHYNISFADKRTGKNVFASERDPRGCKLSSIGYQFIAGVLRHMPAINAVIAPTVNSYKRLIIRGSMSGFTWAPVYVCYGNNNRTNTVRIPLPGKRVEIRSADSACNPYLGLAMAIAAGLEGVEQRLDPGDPHTENMYLKSDAELEALGVKRLPRSLGDAIDAFAGDALGASVMGEKMREAWLAYKREEWQSYVNHVSDWEKSRYLKMF
ncbi:MAG: type III glutamate--ammonia ligase [Alphaproteobacteria bacterium]|nr:type III glutamate--ammonia ligase [Alphaproteobacteria bacterium]